MPKFDFKRKVDVNILEEEFEGRGVFDCDDMESNSPHYDMNTTVTLEDIPKETKEKIIEYYAEEYGMSIEEIEHSLMVKHMETVFIDNESNDCYYLCGQYMTYTIGGNDGDVWWDEPQGHISETFKTVVNMIKACEFVKCDYKEVQA